MKLISQIDWARLAAYVDGEGCIAIKRRHHRSRPTKSDTYQAEVNVFNTDGRLIVWLKNTFGIGHVKCTGRYRRKPIGHQVYCWEVRDRQAGWLLEGILPYLVIKREQAEICLTLRQTTTKGTGREKLSPAILAEREVLKSKLHAIKQDSVPYQKVS